MCATCNECMFDSIHDSCVRDYLVDVNARVKSKSTKSRNAKSKKKKMWKPTEAVNTACYTQNRSLICLCEDLGKLKAKSDIGIFVGYSYAKKAFRIYNKRNRLIMETIHVMFDELTAMASEQFSSRLAPQDMTPGTLCSGVVPNLIP
ncbi:retrovirus-related pol polyprotein from transposon TNT 1-94 [Tanacetum coccineum]